MSDFEKYWTDYGELQASMCGGDIKQFAREIWESAKSGNLTASDWEELEQTTNREKQVYTQSDIEKAKSEKLITMKEARQMISDVLQEESERNMRDYYKGNAPPLPKKVYEAIDDHILMEFDVPDWNEGVLRFYAKQEARWREFYADEMLKERGNDS